MVKGLSAVKDVDCVIYLLDSTKGSGEEEEFILENLKSVKCPVILVINKVDVVEKQKLLPLIERFSKEFSFKRHSSHLGSYRRRSGRAYGLRREDASGRA